MNDSQFHLYVVAMFGLVLSQVSRSPWSRGMWTVFTLLAGVTLLLNEFHPH